MAQHRCAGQNLIYTEQGTAVQIPDECRRTYSIAEIALPGGMIEPSESSADAALRELHEELGVPCDGIELLGQLSPIYVFASDNFVMPWAAVASREPTFILNVDEVAALVELPVGVLV